MRDVTLLRCFLNLFQCINGLVRFAFLYARLRLLIFCLIFDVIHGGSDGLTRIVLFGIHSLAIVSI